MLRLLVSSLLLTSTLAQICPLWNPQYPAPKQLAGSPFIGNATEQFAAVVASLLSGNTTNPALAQAGLALQNNSVSIDVYSVYSEESLFTYHYNAPGRANDTYGVRELDSNTIFRMASISKAWTVYIWLMAVGDRNFNDPITLYIPELAEADEMNANSSDIDVVRWEDVTIGGLASHLGGIARDIAISTTDDVLFQSLNFPEVPAVNGSFCPGNSLLQFPCTRETFFENLISRHPVVPAELTPVYSNVAFQLIAYALENITETSFETLFNKTFVERLSLNSTTYSVPASTDSGIIPGDPDLTFWNAELLTLAPGGGYFSTINDIRRIGTAILNSTYLRPAETRRWLKPRAFTIDRGLTIGAPWEIFPVPRNSSTPLYVYTKAGDLGGYSSIMALIPDYGVGFTILAAGDAPGTPVRYGADLISQIFLPYIEAAAQEETNQIYTGTYVDGDNSTVGFRTIQGYPGLVLTDWIYNGTDVLSTLRTILTGGVETALDFVITIYPTGLTGTTPEGNVTATWRATYTFVPTNLTQESLQLLQEVTGPFTSPCAGWTAVDAFTYEGIGIDEVLFTLNEEGTDAGGVEFRALRAGLLQKVRLLAAGGDGGARKVKRAFEHKGKRYARSWNEQGRYLNLVF